LQRVRNPLDFAWLQVCKGAKAEVVRTKEFPRFAAVLERETLEL